MITSFSLFLFLAAEHMWVRFQAERESEEAKAADMEKRNGEEREREREMISALLGEEE